MWNRIKCKQIYKQTYKNNSQWKMNLKILQNKSNNIDSKHPYKNNYKTMMEKNSKISEILRQFNKNKSNKMMMKTKNLTISRNLRKYQRRKNKKRMKMKSLMILGIRNSPKLNRPRMTMNLRISEKQLRPNKFNLNNKNSLSLNN